MSTQILIRNRARAIVAQLSDFSQFDAVIRDNDLSSWSITCPPNPTTELLRQPGSAMVLVRNNKVILSGPMIMTSRKAEGDSDEVNTTGVSDEINLWDYLAYPGAFESEPNGTLIFPNKVNDEISDFAESAMYHFFESNLMDPQRADTGLPGFTSAGPGLGRGNAVLVKARHTVVGDVLQDIASKNDAFGGPHLSFSVKDRRFAVVQSRDLRNEAVFGISSGNIASYEYVLRSPTATHLLMAGDGEGMGQVFVRNFDTALARRWGRRIEIVVNAADAASNEENDEYDPLSISNMIGNSVKELADRQEFVDIILRPMDVPGRTYGVNYSISDEVTVEGVSGVLKEVRYTLDGNGETITPSQGDISTVNAAGILAERDLFRKLTQRVSVVERFK